MDRLEHEIRDLLEVEGVELLEASSKGAGARMQVRVVADRKVGGLSIEDCVRLTRQIQYLIAEKNLLHNDYRLEVTSPGLDYPLRESWQFSKNLGRLLKVRIPADRGPRELTGRLAAVLDDGFELVGAEQTWQLRFSDCLSAIVLPEFNTKPRVNPRAKESKR